MTKFALLSYNTNNLGDEIQSIAARQFLPRADLLIDRDEWTGGPVAADDEFKIVLNGWFTRNPGKWPPPAFLSPLLISMHITRERFKPAAITAPSEVLMRGESLDYLKRHQPIGCRDLATAELLEQGGVQSYFSGCLTLTLGAGGPAQRRGYVCAVDLSDELYQRLARRAGGRIVRLQHRDAGGGTFERRSAKAGKLLGLYAHAKCVVTTRLHCALPCLAFGTPVLFINEAPDQYRLSGLMDLMRSCDAESFLRDAVDFDFEDPAPNNPAYLSLRETLIGKVQSFTATPMQPYCPAAPAETDEFAAS